jgi:enoyl-CoA hydratase/carnithine racemase
VQQGDIVTCAGVSAGIDLAMWLTGQIVGEAKAKAVQLAIEYDPQPPFDSGHMSKASVATKATATAMLGKDMINPTQLKATTLLLWDAAIQRARGGRKGRKRDLSAVSSAQRN